MADLTSGLQRVVEYADRKMAEGVPRREAYKQAAQRMASRTLHHPVLWGLALLSFVLVWGLFGLAGLLQWWLVWRAQR